MEINRETIETMLRQVNTIKECLETLIEEDHVEEEPKKSPIDKLCEELTRAELPYERCDNKVYYPRVNDRIIAVYYYPNSDLLTLCRKEDMGIVLNNFTEALNIIITNHLRRSGIL